MPANIYYEKTPGGYDQQFFNSQGGLDRYTLGNDKANGVNRTLIDTYFNSRLTDLMNDNRVAVFTGSKIDSFDFGRYLGLLPEFATKHNLLGEVDQMAKAGGNLFQNISSKLASITPQVQVSYTGSNNPLGDGTEGIMYSHILRVDDNRQQQFRFQVTQAMIDAWNTQTAQQTPQANIPADTTTIVLTPDTSYFGDLTSGCFNCNPNSCGRGYRQLFVQKNQRNVNATTGVPVGPQGTPGGSLMSEVIIVLDADLQANGNFVLTVKRGANGQTVTNNSQIQFAPGSVTLAPGDFIFVGAVTPTTQCINDNLHCAYITYTSQVVCSHIKEFQDCIACYSPDRLKTLKTDEVLFSREDQFRLSTIHNMKVFWQRIYNEFIIGDRIYAQDYPMPTHPSLTNVGATATNGELIPAGIKGITRQFDAVAREVEIAIDGCTPKACWRDSIGLIMESLEAGKERTAGTAPSYNDPGWLLWGDVDALTDIYNLSYGIYDNDGSLPVNAEGKMLNEALRNQGMNPYNFSSNPMGLYKAVKDGDVTAMKLDSDFKQMVATQNIKIKQVRFGDYNFRAIHDKMMAYIEPGVIRLIYVPDIAFFTDNLDERQERLFGMNPYLPSTAIKGRLVPSVLSYDLRDVMINGVSRLMSDHNCPMSLFGYMRAGVHLKGRSYPGYLKIRLVAVTDNPQATPQNGYPLTIKSPIDVLNCGCMKVRKQLEYELDSWGNGSIQPAII